MGIMIRHCVDSSSPQIQPGGSPNLALKTDATSPEIAISDFASGTIYIPSGSDITALTYYVAPYTKATYLPAHDSAGVAITQTVSGGNAYAIPAQVFGSAQMQIRADHANNVQLNLKS